MASTGATALADTIFAEIIESRVLEELRPANTSRDFIWFAAKGPSQVASFGEWGDGGAAAAITNDLSEITSTALSDSQVSATASGFGFRVDITDFVREINVADTYALASRQVAAALAEDDAARGGGGREGYEPQGNQQGRSAHGSSMWIKDGTKS